MARAPEAFNQHPADAPADFERTPEFGAILDEHWSWLWRRDIAELGGGGGGTGPPGPAGPAGPTGAPGPAGPEGPPGESLPPVSAAWAWFQQTHSLGSGVTWTLWGWTASVGDSSPATSWGTSTQHAAGTIVLPETGVWLSLQAFGPGGAAGSLGARIDREGANETQTTTRLIADGGTAVHTTATFYATAGDEITCFTFQSSGATDNVNMYLTLALVGGPAGDPGPTGPTGATGAAGAPGATGPAGPTGATGPTGSTGSAGSTGSTGPAGASGSIWRSGTGAPAGALGVVGDWYENDANGDIYEKTGASTYTLRDNLTGPQGAPGSGAADATTTTKGSVQLAGDLSGTAASPQIAAGVIVNADVSASAAVARSKLDFGSGLVNADIAAAAAIAKSKLAALAIADADVAAGAAIAESKLSLATDAAVGTGSRRTIGTGALQAAAGTTRAPGMPPAGQSLWTWTAVTLNAGVYVNIGAGFASAQWLLDASGTVHMRGTVNRAAVGAVTLPELVFSVPAAVAPPSGIRMFTVPTSAPTAAYNYVTARIDLDTTGLAKVNGIWPGTTDVGYLGLDGISWSIL